MVLRALTYGLFLVGPLALLGGQAGQDFRDGRPASACSIADLGPATPSSHLRSINNRGQIIAPGRQSRGAAALLDSAEPGSEAIDIDNLHTVHGINNVGQVAGAIFSPGRGRRAGLGFISGQAYELRGSPDSTCEDLGETINVSWACDINDRGQVVGIYTVRNTQYRGFFWDRATGMHDLGVLLRQRVYSADAIQQRRSDRWPNGRPWCLLLEPGHRNDLHVSRMRVRADRRQQSRLGGWPVSNFPGTAGHFCGTKVLAWLT